eukprot:SAG11_NODE_12751_length_687_cov_0.906463_1_plen_94_part_01
MSDDDDGELGQLCTISTDGLRKELDRRDLASAPNSPIGPINEPGAWDFFISYTQNSEASKLLANKLFSDLGRHGYTAWLDNEMDKVDEKAMEER